jgi:APA family basic amino acid/polyamine antiporter
VSERARLARQIGLGGALLLSFNSVVGSGIFALPAALAERLGAFSPYIFPIAGLVLLLIAVPYARAAAAFDHNGGPAAHGAAFGRLVGFELGWIYYVSRAAAFAANAAVLAAYAARWWAPLSGSLLRALLIVAVIGGLTAINIAGVRRSMRLLAGLTLLKALPLIVLASAALLLAGFPAPGPPPPLTELEGTLLLALYAFIGFENSTATAGETRAPGATIPRALLATIAATACLFFLVQLAFVAALPDGASDATAPLLDLGGSLAGPVGAGIVTLAAIASLSGNLHSNLAATPRVTQAMGERGDLPAWFGAISMRFGTPANSILFLGLLSAALALSGGFVWLAVVSTLSRIIVYGVTAATLLRGGAGKLWLGHATIAIAACLWLAAQAEPVAWATLLALAAAGLILYASNVSSRRIRRR